MSYISAKNVVSPVLNFSWDLGGHSVFLKLLQFKQGYSSLIVKEIRYRMTRESYYNFNVSIVSITSN